VAAKGSGGRIVTAGAVRRCPTSGCSGRRTSTSWVSSRLIARRRRTWSSLGNSIEVIVSLRLKGTYIGSAVILLAIAVVFVFEMAMGVVANDAGLIKLGALPDASRLNGEYWRLVSFGLIHWDLTHLLLNSGLLLVAGPIAERRAGAGWLLAVFLAASVASGAGILVKHFLFPSSGASLGASGGMFGLLGFALVLAFRFPPRGTISRRVLMVVVVCAFAYSLLPGISMVGHVVGFVIGIVAGFGIAPRVQGGAAPEQTV
jgi:membrane associated rhomboid family serine protease